MSLVDFYLNGTFPAVNFDKNRMTHMSLHQKKMFSFYRVLHFLHSPRLTNLKITFVFTCTLKAFSALSISGFQNKNNK